MNAYEATTHGIRVSVIPEFLADRSEPDDNYFVWAYTIVIENTSERTVTLRTRHWEIIDANGQRQHVDGEGVVRADAHLVDLTKGGGVWTPVPAMRAAR